MRPIPALLCAVVLAPALLAAHARAADAPAIQPATAPTTQPADAVRPGDLLIVAYPDLLGMGVEYRRPGRVGADGKVSVPYLPDGVRVEGLSLADAEKSIARELRAAQIIANAWVAIDRQERGDAASVKPGPIAPGDIVRFAAWDLSGPAAVENVRTLHVSEAGNIGLPYLGQTRVAGLTEAEAEAAIIKAYADQQIVRNAVVSLLRVARRAAPEPIPDSITPGASSGKR